MYTCVSETRLSYLTHPSHADGRLVLSTRRPVNDPIRLADIETVSDRTAVELAELFSRNCEELQKKHNQNKTLTAQISLGIFPFCRNTGGNLVHSWIPTMPLCSNNVPLRVQNTHNALMFLGIRSISDPGTDLEWKQACGPFLTLVTLSDVSQIWPWPLLLKPLI